MASRSVTLADSQPKGDVALHTDRLKGARSRRIPGSTLAAVVATLLRPARQRRRDSKKDVWDHTPFAELALRRIEAFGFAGKFGSALAHAVSTPLGVITGRIMLALRKLPEDSAARDDLRVVLAQAERVAQVMQQALEPLRPPPPAMSPVDPRALMLTVLPPFSQLAEALSIELEVSLAQESPRISGDFEQLASIVRTALMNALEMTPTGGRVSLTVGRRQRDEHDLVVDITIADGGPGLSPALLLHAFDPLYLARMAASGVSLALSSARDIIRAHGGELRVTSQPGAGTSVMLELPAMKEEER